MGNGNNYQGNKNQNGQRGNNYQNNRNGNQDYDENYDIEGQNDQGYEETPKTPVQQNQNRSDAALTAKQKDLLVKLAGITYTVTGYAPVKAEWKLTPEQIKEIVLRNAKSFISDIAYVTIETNSKTGAISTYVWLSNKSKHLRDTNTLNEQSAVNRPIIRYSRELKEFMGKFCEKNKQRTLAEETNYQVVGIEILLERFFMIEFDVNGDKYASEFPGARKQQTRLRCVADYTKSNEATYGKLKCILVSKATKSELAQLEPRAKRSYQAGK